MCGFHAVHHGCPRRTQTNLGHGIAKQAAVLCHVDGFAAGADQFHAEFLQHAFPYQVERTVQGRLSTHGRQQRIRALLVDNVRHGLPVHRLDIHGIRHIRIGHDGSRVGVHQHHPVAFLAQRLAGLRARVVKLACLTDHDRASADNQDTVDVGTFWHDLARPRPDGIDKTVKQRRHIMRTGTRLRMALETECAAIGARHTLQRTIKQ